MILYDTKIEAKIKNIGFTLEDVGMAGRTAAYFLGCNWWRLTYNHLDYSIYYDSENVIAPVGKPYYEFYDGKNAKRMITEEHFEELFLELIALKKQYELDVITNPERFI